MCTCIAAMQSGGFYFGRNLDLHTSFGERVTVVPRGFALRHAGGERTRYAMIGMANVTEGVPLFADAANEKGVCMAGLYFPGNAHYFAEGERKGGQEVAPHELIPWLLGGCRSAKECACLLKNVIPVSRSFAGLPVAQLHWMVADREGCYVAEPRADGMHVYENDVHVLTNNPPFGYHRQHLNDYLNLTPGEPVNRMAPALALHPYGQGMGAVGLPGDASPASRFVRASYYTANSVCGEGGKDAVTQFFHLLGSVEMVRGGVMTAEGRFDVTTYSCCIDAARGNYYYRTYGNSRINAVRLTEELASGDELACYPLSAEEDVLYRN